MVGSATTYRRSGDFRNATLHVHGELDLFQRDRFCAEAAAVLESAVGDVRLDLSGLTFVDSAGISALLHVGDEARRQGVRLRVAIPDGVVGRVLTLTGVAGLLAGEGAPVAAIGVEGR